MEKSDQDDYEKLPASIQAIYSRKEWLWLSDAEKAGLVERECEPEVYDD
jgi:hypothetical protein